MFRHFGAETKIEKCNWFLTSHMALLVLKGLNIVHQKENGYNLKVIKLHIKNTVCDYYTNQ